MRKLLLLMIALLAGVSGAWAQITVGPSTGKYWKNGSETSDEWAPVWKSNAKAADATTPLLVLTGETGMYTPSGDIYSNQTYTLEAPSGYIISGYTFNGTATDGDVTITPAGESGTLISNGNSLGEALSVTVRARTTTFALSGSGHIASLNLVVTVSPIPVTIAYCPGYTTSGCSHSLPTVYGSFTGTTLYTTGDASGLAGVTITPSSGLSIGSGLVNVNAYGKCFSLTTGAGNTDYTVTMTAPTGYVITGYSLACSANSNSYRHTLTSADGSVVVEVTSPPNQGNTSKAFEVTGLNTNSTYFTIRTANGGNALYLPIFQIYVAKASEVVSDTYKVMFNGTQVATKTEGRILGSVTAPTIPTSLQKSYCTYQYYSDEDCTSPLSTLPSSGTTIYAKCTYPFTVSSDFATATWYYATLRGKQLRADDGAKDGSGRYQTNSTNERTDAYKWAFFGNPYDNIYVMNKAQGSTKYLYKDSQLIFKSDITPASDNKALFAVSANSNGGFSLRNIDGGATWYINDAGNGGNLGFWNSGSGANDAGSNWVVEDAAASDKALLSGALTTANSIYTASSTGAGKLGYPTAAALTTFNTAISTAQGVYDDANGDYYSAYNTLNAAIATLKASVIYTPRTDVYYTIVNARGAMVYDPSHDESVDVTSDNANYIWYGSTTPDDADVNNLWGFIEQDEHYYMYNVGKQQFASVGTGTYGSTWIFNDTPAYITLDDGVAHEIAVPKVRVRATIATTSATHTMSVSTSYTGPVITYDAQGDGGVPMLFVESATAVDPDVTDIMVSKVTDLTPYKNALKEVIDACDGVVLGSAIGRYAENATYSSALTAANTTYNNASATKGDLQTATSNLEAAIATLSLNTPTAGFYRLKNVATDKYLTAVSGPQAYNATSKGVYANGDGSSAATVIRLYDKNSDGKLYMYNQGDGFGWVIADKSVGAGVGYLSTNPDKYVNWLPGTADGQIAFAICYGNGTGSYASYLRKGIYKADTSDDDAVIGGTDETADEAQWVVEAATSATVTLHSDGAGNYYATFCAPFSYTVSSGTKAYTLEESGSWLVPTEVVGEVPAGTPVLLKGTSATATLTIGTGYQNSTPLTTTSLTGAYLAKTIEGASDYVLGIDGEGVVGFYHWDSNDLAANRAYIDTPAEVKGFVINWGDVDGINSVQGSGLKVQDSEIYNLAGQRMSRVQKGINIVNGKKVMVK